MVESRGRIGDWEIDTVHGSGKACPVTVVERKTGLVRIGKIKRVTMELTLARTVKLLWQERERVKTITADNGTFVPQLPGDGKHPWHPGLLCDAPPRMGERNR